MSNPGTQQRIRQYLAKAQQVLDSGRLALEHHDYITAVNRAYYAIFYAANALLTTKGLERSKHSGVVAAFRQHFVKPGLIEPEYSDFYGATMDERSEGDYVVDAFLDHDIAERALSRAERFLTRIELALREMGEIR
ncbi:MAG: HEPN domain-containing protein [Anaerolineae bacterium]